ncbi:MAG TPA: glycosyltransferase family 1 protein [Thermoanaerobaculia bacterium]|nr:glycosyltransferase family 1 protein [Thermoanaerobaculia bacterium]
MRIGMDCRKIGDFGIGSYIRGLLHALAALGGEEYVAFGPAEIGGALPAGVEHVVVDAPKYSLRELFRIGRAADRARLDLFHAPHYVVPFLRTPFVVTIHDLIHLRRRNPLQRVYAQTMIGRAVRRSRRVLSVSRAVGDEIAEAFGHGDKIAVTPNGVDPQFLAPGPAERGRYFLFVGNDKPHKNVERLIAAFGQLRGVELVLAGAEFARFRGTANVTRAGFVELQRLAALYRGAIAVVQPSLEEGFGLPALEAMACGTPAITSNTPALLEVTGDAALHVDGRDVDEIAAAMRRVMDDPALRATLGARGAERARTFSWSRCAALTRDAYRSAFRLSKGNA